MKTEKIITSQAKSSLKGNWIPIIAAFLFVFAVMLFIDCLQSIALVAMDAVDFDTGEYKDGGELILFATDVLCFIATALISPLFNGIIKMCYAVAKKDKPTAGMLFYCFRSPSLYLKTLLLNLLPMIFLGVVFIIFMTGALYIPDFTADLQGNEIFGIILYKLAEILINAVIAFLLVLTYFLFIHFPLFLYADDCGKSIAYYYGRGFALGLNHIASTVKLFLRFIGWILLCFFVVPAFYVIPYFAVSFATSAKWLISLEKDRGLL